VVYDLNNFIIKPCDLGDEKTKKIYEDLNPQDKNSGV
jgi:hypothetical protein